jgi:DNA polymerase-3 subunit beta
MKILTLKESLKNGLAIVERVAGKNLTLPILNNVLIETSKNFLILSTTNLETAIRHRFLVKTEKEGKTTVPVKFLLNLISLLPGEKITLEEKNKSLFISCEDYKSSIKSLNPEDFPIIPKIEQANFIEINNLPFCRGISQLVDFCSNTQVRPELTGVFFNFQKNKLHIAATDGFRLAEKILFLEKSIFQEYSFILPQRTSRELVNIFGEKEGKIKIYFSPNQIVFEYPSEKEPNFQTQIISRLIDGEYPKYQEIIPQKYETKATLFHSAFLNQIKTASLFSSKSNEIKIKPNLKKSGLEVFSENQEVGENQSFLKCELEGKETGASFNYRFLLEGINSIKSQKVVFEINGDEGPAVLRPVGDQSYLYVVMPIKNT